MNEILKQRLVGALILVALGVVFWPIIFVQPGEPTADNARPIPPRPEVNTQPIASPRKDSLRASPQLESRSLAEPEEQKSEAASKPKPEKAPVPKKPAVKKSKTRTEAPVKPAIDAEGVPIAWILQVASVSTVEKAEEIRNRLIKMGYKAYVKKVKRSGKTLSRVYVGPNFEREKLDKMKSRVDVEFGVSSLVVRYLP